MSIGLYSLIEIEGRAISIEKIQNRPQGDRRIITYPRGAQDHHEKYKKNRPDKWSPLRF